MSALLQRFFNIRKEEIGPLFVAAFYFFCVLTALMVLRPARDALGMTKGMDDIRWLFVATAGVTLIVNPIFGWLVCRFQRITFITATYGFFAVSLIGFYALLTLTPQAVGETSGLVFYVWFSVFNLFCTMVFWALMADRFTLEQSKRLFGTIAVGGTLGAICGPALASLLAKPLGTPALLLVAAGFLALSVVAAWIVVWLRGDQTTTVNELAEVGDPTGVVEPPQEPQRDIDNSYRTSQSSIAEVKQAPLTRKGEPTAAEREAVIGGNPFVGLIAVFRSPYLLGISGYMLVLSMIATFIYFTRLEMVAVLEGGTDDKTKTFANIDLITQSATLLLQVVVAGHIMRRLGVSVALAILPVLMSLGFIGLAIMGSLTALVALDVAFKAVQRAIMQPARQTLFTVVSREDKYKSKAFADTFVYRGGDALGAWIVGILGSLSFGLIGLMSVAVPLSIVWGLLGLWLGREQKLLADAPSEAEDGKSTDSTSENKQVKGQRTNDLPVASSTAE